MVNAPALLAEQEHQHIDCFRYDFTIPAYARQRDSNSHFEILVGFTWLKKPLEMGKLSKKLTFSGWFVGIKSLHEAKMRIVVIASTFRPSLELMSEYQVCGCWYNVMRS